MANAGRYGAPHGWLYRSSLEVGGFAFRLPQCIATSFVHLSRTTTLESVVPAAAWDAQLAIHELEESARPSIGGLLLLQKRQSVLLENLEELLPRNFFESFVRLAEVES